MSRTVAGIDPGKTGALSILFPDGSARTLDVPLTKLKGKVKPAWSLWSIEWSIALALDAPDMIVIENIAARPGQGVTSMFTFGRTLGFVHAIAYGANVPVHFVTPAVWQGKLGLLKSDKNANREKVRTLYPLIAPQVTRVKDDGRADATLLAHYGKMFL